MAAGISMVGVQFGTAVVSNTDTTTIIEPNYGYEIVHTGFTGAGLPTTTALFVGIGSTVVDTFAEATNKYVLVAGKKMYVAPGNTMIAYEANGSPAGGLCISISRSAEVNGGSGRNNNHTQSPVGVGPGVFTPSFGAIGGQ